MVSYQKKLENDPNYLNSVRALATAYNITFEQMLDRERKFFADVEKSRAQVASAEALKAIAKEKIRNECVYFCYQELGKDVYDCTDGEMIHGWYRIVKTDTCYEFTIMDTDLEHESWQHRIAEKHVTRFPLDMMGKGSFANIPPEKIHEEIDGDEECDYCHGPVGRCGYRCRDSDY